MIRTVENLAPEVQSLHRLGVLRDIDVYLVETVLRRFKLSKAPPSAQLALALASRAIGESHVCLDLSAVTPEWIAGLSADRNTDETALHDGIAKLCRKFRSSAACGKLFESCRSAVGEPGSGAPFILSGSLLYLRRYWMYEHRVACRLLDMAKQKESTLSPATQKLLAGLLDQEEQRNAARLALTRRFSVITGGPGTGKTYVAARILAVLTRMRNAGEKPLRIRMAAPTGKAAARMDESVGAAGERGPAGAAGAQWEPACTIERLLGYVSGSPYFRHDARNTLPADVVLIDEASMIDLAKMAKLLDALAPETRLILLGDMRQLASVQPGSVLAEICEAQAMKDCVARLTESRRFGSDAPLGRLSAAVNGADSDATAAEAWRTVGARSGGDSGIRQRDTPEFLTERSGAIESGFAASILAGYRDFMAADTPEEAFKALAGFRVLCALRRGRFGAEAVNRAIEDVLSLRAVRADGPAKDLLPARRLDPRGDFYDHRVVMVTTNDYSLNVFNGDIGVVLPDGDADNELVVYFEKTGRIADGGQGFRKISRRLLPEHETAFAMTIHKSQGSEFDRVLVVLPDRDNPVLTRELVYTAITRARIALELMSSEDVFCSAIRRRVERFSGLGIQLSR